jgi:type VI secretion system VasD/TssJ family lipoprotein
MERFAHRRARFARLPARAALLSLLLLMAAGLYACGGGGAKSLTLDLDPRNPNTCGGDEAHTLWVRVFQLRANNNFQAASLEDLWQDSPEALAQDLIGTGFLTSIDPGNRETVSTQDKLSKETRYIGVVGNFCALEGSCWKTAVPVNVEDEVVYRIEARETCLTLTPVRR